MKAIKSTRAIFLTVMMVTLGCDIELLGDMSWDWSETGGSLLEYPASVSGRVYESGTRETLDNFRASFYDRSLPPSIRSDFSFSAPSGLRTLTIEKYGYERWTRKLNLKANESRTVTVYLVPETTDGRDDDAYIGPENGTGTDLSEQGSLTSEREACSFRCMQPNRRDAP